MLVARELLQDARGRRDRVGAEKEAEPAANGGCDEAERERLVTGDVAVDARRHLRRQHLVGDDEVLARLAVVVPRLEGARVAVDELWARGELGRDEVERDLDRPAVEPRHEAEREEVLRALRLTRRDALDLLQRLDRHRAQRDGVHVVLVERAVLKRVCGVARLLEIPIGERIAVDDERAALAEIAEVRLQRRRVHRHEHVRLVARRQDVVVGEVDLEAGRHLAASLRARGSPPGSRATWRDRCQARPSRS